MKSLWKEIYLLLFPANGMGADQPLQYLHFFRDAYFFRALRQTGHMCTVSTVFGAFRNAQSHLFQSPIILSQKKILILTE